MRRDADRAPRSSEIVLRTWPHCADNTTVQLYTIVKGSHTWPGADPKASPLYTTQQIDATALMLTFFAAHHLPNELSGRRRLLRPRRRAAFTPGLTAASASRSQP